jgi:hypothetical protein
MAKELILIPKEKYNMMLKIHEPDVNVIKKNEVLPSTSKTMEKKKTKRKTERGLIVKRKTNGPPPGFAIRKKDMKNNTKTRVQWLKL